MSLKNRNLFDFFVNVSAGFGNFKIKGKREGSVNFVREGFIHTKNVDSLKTRLKCHRWRDGAKGTTFI